MIYTLARLVWKGFCGFYILFIIIIIIMNFFLRNRYKIPILLYAPASHTKT